MTIRRQIFLFVTLLFLGVGAVGAGVAHWLETEVVRLAFDDRARGLAVTLAEFIEPADVAALKGGTPLAQTRLGAVWSRLGRWAIVQRFFLLEAGSGRVLADTAPAGTPSPGAAAWQELGSAEVRPLTLRVTADGHALLPMVARTAGGAAVVGVEISADAYLRERASIRHDMEVDALLAVVVGLAVAAVLGWLIRRPILRLGEAVDKIGAPAFSHDETGSVIREVAELGNTFGVMHSVLGETVEKGRRTLVERDTYRSEGGLAAAYRRALQPPAAWSGAGAEAAWLSVGAPSPPAFAGALALGPSGGAAFAGVDGSAGELGPTVRARAASSFLADALVRQPLAAAAAETQSLFRLKQLTVVRWQDSQLEWWRGGSEASGAATDAAAWSAGAPVALACLGGVNQDRLGLYLANFSSHPAARLLDELPPLLDADEPGVVLVLRRLATS